MPVNISDLRLSRRVGDYGLLRFAADQEEGMVGAGQATAFVTGISLLNKQDVMNSTLLAQLAASGQYDREKDTQNWYNYYKTILEGIGWIVTDFVFTEKSLSNVAVSVDKIVLEFLTTYLAPAQLTLLQRLITSLQNSSDPVVNIFNTSSSSDTQSNFQIGICSQDVDQNVMFSIGAFHYNTSQRITNVLFTSIKSGSAHFFNAHQGMILNQQIYATVRQAVIEKLGQHAADLIGSIVLPPL